MPILPYDKASDNWDNSYVSNYIPAMMLSNL